MSQRTIQFGQAVGLEIVQLCIPQERVQTQFCHCEQLTIPDGLRDLLIPVNGQRAECSCQKQHDPGHSQNPLFLFRHLRGSKKAHKTHGKGQQTHDPIHFRHLPYSRFFHSTRAGPKVQQKTP